MPHVNQLEGEKKKIEQVPEKVSADKPTEMKKGVDLLGESFEQPIEGCPKCVRIESAAIKHLCTGEGVMSTKPSEIGQMPKGIQPGFIEKVDDDEEAATMAAMVDAELNEVEPSYKEARMRSDWPEWRKAIDVELQNLKSAGTWNIVERPSNVNIVDSK